MAKTARAHIPLSLVFLALTQDMGLKVDFSSLNSIWYKCGIFRKQFSEQKNTDPKDQRLSYKKSSSNSNPEDQGQIVHIKFTEKIERKTKIILDFIQTNIKKKKP